eukprot:9415287-Alexandrium_andersonii.AAC.1
MPQARGAFWVVRGVEALTQIRRSITSPWHTASALGMLSAQLQDAVQARACPLRAAHGCFRACSCEAHRARHATGTQG